MPIENVVANTATADPQRLGGTAPKVKAKRRAPNRLDSDASQKLHGRLMAWLVQERNKQGPNRYQMAVDEDFYDGLQWTDEEMAALIERGQAPLVYNKIKQAINWMLGTERRTRVDGKVLPRTEDDENEAEVKSKLLKYLSDVNRTPFKTSEAWKSCIVAGLGWMEDAINKDPSQELLATRYVDWKQVYHDSNAREMDLTDARYLFRWSFIDIDVAEALCPDRATMLRSAAIDDAQIVNDEDDVWYMGSRVNGDSSGDYAGVGGRGGVGTYTNMGRERVKIIEAWYRMPVAVKVCRADYPEARKFHGEIFDATNPEMQQALDDGYMSVANHVKMQVRVALMTEDFLLYEGESPYKHDRFPLTPMWCYRRNRDGLPYGVIRDIRDAQVDYNKRASKALYILSTVRVVMDTDAVDDVEELRDEIARPDSIISKKRGTELRIEQDKQLAQEHINLMQFDGQMIRDISGVTEQNMGGSTHDMSGKAIGKLQDQGSIVTAPLFDNMRLSIQIQNEIRLSLLEQFYTMPKVVRLVGENQPIDWLRINQWDEGAAQFINDITRSKADFVVDEQDFHASTREAMFESMMDLVGKLPPEYAMAMLDMVIDFANVPNKTELVARIRKLNGQSDPNRRPSPEEQQAQAQRDQQAQEMQQLQTDTVKAQLAKTQAETAAAQSKVSLAEVEVLRGKADALLKNVTAAYEAMQAAQIVSTVPGVTPVADAILAGSGYEDRAGQDPNIPAPAIAPAAMPPQLPTGAPPPQLQQADGAQAGIQTPGADGVRGFADGGYVSKALDGYDALSNEHPNVKLVLDLLPLTGSVTSAIDVASDIHKGEYLSAAGDALGLIPGFKTVKTALSPGKIKQVAKVLSENRRAIDTGVNSIPEYAGKMLSSAHAQGAPAPADQAMPLGVQNYPSGQLPIPGYANGGQIQGPGTGTSDSIPAVTDAGEPLQVSTGEYIIPADVVQALGREFFDDLLRNIHKPT